MANTTPIVTTVTKPATKEKTLKDADATPRVNIQDLCEEHFEDILPVIMDKIRRDKRKEVHVRLDFGERRKKKGIGEKVPREKENKEKALKNLKCQDLVRQWDRRGRERIRSDFSDSTRKHITNRDPVRKTLECFLTVEVALTGGTLLTEIVLRAETDLTVWKNHMIIPAPPTIRGPNMYITLATETDFISYYVGKREEKCIPVILRFGGKRWPGWAAPAIEDTRSQRAARVWFDELPPESIDGYKDVKVDFLAYFMQQKKYVKDPVKIHNIKQRDGETIEEFME
ncbi:hypothetical protein Tco_1034924 [Tanacetum coccineum]